MNTNYATDSFRGRFRYNLKQLMDFEKDESIQKQRYHTAMILFVGFILYSAITIIPCVNRGYLHGMVSNLSIIVVFLLAMLHLQLFHNHASTVILGSYELCLVLFIHFITETDWTIGMDAFWLFILVMPFITDYMAGVVYGTIAAFSGLILSFVCFHTRMLYYLQPYGKNMINWFTVIYFVMMMASAVIEYELTTYQIDKKLSDEKISFYQKERTHRLQRLLEIYESNEQTIRKYKHDVRHYNRVLAGFIQNKEYDEAAKYLQEFDDMLETVTSVSFCDNPIVNELLSIYANRCQKMGFKPRFKAVVPEHFPIESTDLTSLVGNILENACEALSHVEEERRALQFEITYDGRKLKLFTRNPYTVETTFKENGLPVSTREVQSGVGTAQIKGIAEKYGGVASFTQEEDSFTVKAVLTCM
ncbi:GHKL domain-containing protein [Butyrivibrio sp. CB08]|uniref:sensor histidine kinase n=1 Tax=Butyrivibrio sp. CB08 TaxID=2364879 RepID=UPI000EAA0289|nr:GHKL domain-containing protein [Butyrivibrio sp. CB08]RKM57919.1 GHKL domain-containing protein [Butyrivibrio sp. CB08]